MASDDPQDDPAHLDAPLAVDDPASDADDTVPGTGTGDDLSAPPSGGAADSDHVPADPGSDPAGTAVPAAGATAATDLPSDPTLSSVGSAAEDLSDPHPLSTGAAPTPSTGSLPSTGPDALEAFNAAAPRNADVLAVEDPSARAVAAEAPATTRP